MTEGDKPKGKMGRPATGNAKPRQLGRVHDHLWEKLHRAAEIAGEKFTPWALHVLLREADRLIEQDEKERAKGVDSKEK